MDDVLASLKAIDPLYKRLLDDHVNFGDIFVISGAGQMGFTRKNSIYWLNNADLPFR